MKRYKFIIYDLDGTLIDTRLGVISAVKKTIKELDLPLLGEEIIAKFAGPPMQDSFEKYYDFSRNAAIDAANLFRDNYNRFFLYEAILYPGIIDVIKTQVDNDIKISVGTNKSHENARLILNHFGIAEFCSVLRGADCKGVLSKADIINLCIKELNANKKEVLYIGDSKYDSDGAEIAGIDFLAVLYGFGFRCSDDVENVKHIGECYDACQINKILNI